MKITLIGPYPPFRGGISDFNYSLSKQLEVDQELQLINFTTQYPHLLFPGKTQYKTNQNTTADSNRILSSINYFSWRRTANSILKFDPELIIVQYWMPFFSFSYNSVINRIKRKTNSQVVSICHNLIPHEDKKLYKWFTKRFISNIDKFILMSQSVEKDLTRFLENAEYITTFHPVYDLFGNIMERQSARKKLGLKSKNIVLFFGLIREYKGLDILLNSIPLIKEKINDIKIVIAGECYENERKYTELIKKLDIDDDLIWRNEFIADHDVSKYFSAADLVVLPYKTATQSGVTQLAYNFNRPVIISNVGGLSEIVKDGVTGYVVEPGPQEFATAIIKYYKETKFDEFSQNVYNVKQEYSWETFVQKLLEFAMK